MKRTYVKPEVNFESFVMSTNIAGDCEPPFVNNASKGTCAVLGGAGLAIFDSQLVSECNATPESMGGAKDYWDGICYHIPDESHNLFNS